MQLEVVKNTRRNLIYGFINKIVTLFFPFITRMIIIRKLGEQYLGLDGLFTSILQVLNLSEFGFSTAIVYSMYKPIAEDDSETICALLAIYKKVYKIVGLAIGGIGLILMPFLPNLIGGTYPKNVNIYILYIIYLFNTIISYMLFAYKTSILNAFQREDLISNINTISKSFLYVFQIAAVLLVESYYVYLLVLPISTILNNILVSIVVKKNFPQYVCKGFVSKEIKADIKIKVAGLIVQKLCSVSRNAFDSIFVSIFLGLTATAIYNNYFYVITAITALTGIISTALMAGVGNHVAINDAKTNLDEMRKIDFVYMVIGGWCSISLCCLYQPFMELWMGEKCLLPNASMILFVIYFYCLKIGDVRLLYVSAAGLWWENKFRSIAEALANIFLNYILGKYYGVNGIICATIITILLINFLYGAKIVFDNYFGKDKYLGYIIEHIKYALVTFVVGLITSWLISLILIDNLIICLLLRMLICCTVPFFLYVIIYRNTDIYINTREWIQEKIMKIH